MKNPYTLQVIRGGEVTYTENARSFGEAIKMAHVHLAPEVEVFITLEGNVHAILRQPKWAQVLRALSHARSVDMSGNSEPANGTEA